MAKENTVWLYGAVVEEPVIDPALQGRITLRCLRRTKVTETLSLSGGEVYNDVPVYSRDTGVVKYMDGIKIGDMVLVKGTLSSKDINKKYVCPHCGKVSERQGVIMYVDPIHVRVVERGLTEREYTKKLQDSDEISNHISIAGTVCNPPDLYVSEDNKRICSFQIASNRNRIILQDDPEDRADFPWVRSFGPIAEDNYERLEVGKSVYIDGALSSRDIIRHIECDKCGQTYDRKSTAMEIVTYYTRYIHDEEDVVEEPDDIENTVWVFGLAHAPKCKVDKSSAEFVSGMFYLDTVRRSFTYQITGVYGPVYSSLVCIRSKREPVIRKYIQDVREGDFVFVKGVLCSQSGRITVTCPDCQSRWKGRPNDILYIDPVFIKKMGNPKDAGATTGEEKSILRNADEISNHVQVIGRLTSPVEYEPDNRFCTFSMEINRNRHLLRDRDSITTDEVEVKAYSHADEYAQTLNENSVVYINGSLNYSEETAKCKCPKCGKIFDQPYCVQHIIPYHVEYFEDCDVSMLKENEVLEGGEDFDGEGTLTEEA